MTTWKLQDAKNRFSAVLDAAPAGEHQEITRKGKPVVVDDGFGLPCRTASGEANTPNLVEQLLAIPQSGSDDLSD